MQFITLQFFLFFVGVFLVAVLLKDDKKQYPRFLLIVSLVFYLFFGIYFFLLLLGNIIVNYFFLKSLDKYGKKALSLSIIVNVIFLAAFKYYNFGIDSLLQVYNYLGIPADINVLRILIPVGISFYTFRNISHLVDCYRKILPVPTFIDFANYVAFFPQIMSGPIMRAKEFYTHLHAPNLFKYSQGRIITLILSGLIKKYVIASFLFDASASFASPENYSSVDLIISAFAYSIMIFVDFSGYSDLAIAISNLLGFQVDRNFYSPYSAIGLKDFWSRWHISLSLWLRDYVYIPLGGSRKGKTRKYINILITMFVSGLWHGAGLTFIVWGLLHGIGSVISHLIAEVWGRFFPEDRTAKPEPFVQDLTAPQLSFENGSGENKKDVFDNVNKEEFNEEIEGLFENISQETSAPQNSKSPFVIAAEFVGWLVTFVYVTFAWIFFTSSSMENALTFIGSIFTSTIAENKIFNGRLLVVILVVLLFNFIGNFSFVRSIRFFDRIPIILRIPIAAIAVYAILQLGPETMPPFIYFSF